MIFNGWLSSTNYVWSPWSCHKMDWIGNPPKPMSSSDHPHWLVSVPVCPGLYNKSQNLGEATKIFLEYKIQNFMNPQAKKCLLNRLNISFE